MKTVSRVRAMQNASRRWRAQGKRIALVPTMGFLHEGHLSLIRVARQKADTVVVSIFVNPAQFGPSEDLASYPRDLPSDKRLCRREGVDVVYCPDEAEMYGADYSVYVEETRLSQGLCGACRPGHFRGVTTVVAKLMNAVQPDVAVFGRKDAQQARVIQKMVADLDMPVRIVVAPIVREPDGLAMSSRNRYLSLAERSQATCLFEGLELAARLAAEGEQRTARLRAAVRKTIRHRAPGAGIEYVESVDNETLTPVNEVRAPVLLAAAVKLGGTRLIDNAVINPPAGGVRDASCA